ncbi:MAG: DUF4959 domain-containing protein [Bacteroidales bacterium]|jgi:hypothetical protein|nr:DUF4959 domain-containing protein [Bacteroidales bacterium]
MNIKKHLNYPIYWIALIWCVASCEEGYRYEVNYTDNIAPGSPTITKPYLPLHGGARFYFDIPDDRDLLSINAEYTTEKGKIYTFSASYFSDSLDVLGWGDTKEHEVTIYALDRAGNKSVPVIQRVTPLESVTSRVAATLEVIPAFSSFFVNWVNELKQNINVFVEFRIGTEDKLLIYTSNDSIATQQIRDQDPAIPIQVQVHVEDEYGNISKTVEFGDIELLQDEEIPKSGWVLPKYGFEKGTVLQVYGDGVEGRLEYVIDGVIDLNNNVNFMNTFNKGATGLEKDGNVPWNLILDLGDYYQLSRINTVQRHDHASETSPLSRGMYYGSENVGLYNMYFWDDEWEEWIWISEHKIPIPAGLSETEISLLGQKGDEAVMYPYDPRFTKPTRWFRYEALKAFDGNYSSTVANCLSEITLYGKKANSN